MQLRGLWLLWAQAPDYIRSVQGSPGTGGRGRGSAAARWRGRLGGGLQPAPAAQLPELAMRGARSTPQRTLLSGHLTGRAVACRASGGLGERTSLWAATGPARQTGACHCQGMNPKRVGLGEERAGQRRLQVLLPPAPAAPTQLRAREPLRVPSLDSSETESWGAGENPHWAWGAVLAVPRKVQCAPKFRWWGKAETALAEACVQAPAPRRHVPVHEPPRTLPSSLPPLRVCWAWT